MVVEESAEPATDAVTWERMEGESVKAYSAFCTYRDMRTERSILKAYRQHTGIVQALRASGCWTGWAEQYRWAKRAEAYDLYCEQQVRKQAEQQYDSDLQAYRDKVRQLAAVTMQNAVGLLVRLNTRIQSLEPDDISAAMIPGYVRAASFVAQVAAESMAQTLAIEQLMQQITQPATGEHAAPNA